jgi:hypothetical protein
LLKFNVYKKEQESYITYCTPEATVLIDQYLKWRERLGEQLTPNSPVFRANFDPFIQTKRPQIISSEAVGKMMNRLLEETEIKAPSTFNYKKRNETMETHGLRKFFKTTCINAGMNPLYSEYVMGHRSGLTKSYFKPSDMELLEGNDKALGYTSAINDLTINEEYRLRKKIDELTEKKDEIEIMEIRHNQEIKTMQEQMTQIITMIQHNPKLAKIKPQVLATKKTHI